MDYVDQSHWDDGYRRLEFSTAADRVTGWIASRIPAVPAGEHQSVFEFGCFPGRYLSFFGSLGYEVNGCDVTPRTDEMARWLASRRLKIGTVMNADALSLGVKPVHDVVYSIGFIEHFEDYPVVIDAHDRQLRPGGTMVLACPNFRGAFQNRLHRTFDRRNLGLHNVKAMDPAEWARILERVGYVIEFAGFFGGFDFWTDDGLERPGFVKKAAAIPIKLMGRAMARFPDGEAWSPYVGLVARKADAA
jgi:SAM-dependent methyltransferase